MNNTNNNLPVITSENPTVYKPSTVIRTDLITFEVTEMQAKKLESLPTPYKHNAKTVFGLLNLNENINIQIIALIGEMHETYKKNPIKDGKKTVGFNDFINGIYEEYIDKDKISRFVGIYTYIIKEPYFDAVRDTINNFSYSNLVSLYQYIKKEPSQKTHVMDLIKSQKLTTDLTHKAFINILTAIETPNNANGNNANGNNANGNNGTDNGTDNNGTDNGTDNNGTDNGTDNNGTDNGTDDNANGTDNNGTDNDDKYTRFENGIGYTTEAIEINGEVKFRVYTTMTLTQREAKQIVTLLEKLDEKRKK